MKPATTIASLVALTVSGLPGAAPAENLALVGGDVYPISGPMQPGATVLVEGSRIRAVGRNVGVPAGYQRIDCSGKWVTPGFIESASQIGLVEVSLESSTVDAEPELDDPVRAALYAGDAVDVRSTLVGVARRHGVTHAVAMPAGGLISGRSAWLALVGARSRLLPRAVRGPVAMHAALGESAAAAVHGSRASAIVRLAEAFDDARIYARNRSAYGRRQLYRLNTSRLDLVALQDVVARRIPLIVRASRAADISVVLRFSQKERLRVAILGAEEGWLVADALARRRVPVILQPLADLPRRFEARHARADNAALLARAGVDVALTTLSSHRASGLRFLVGNAVRAGLDRDAALRAVTLTPAKIYGMDDRTGSLAARKEANIVVWSGDPFEPRHHAEMVIIAGEIQPLESRQTRLARRHLERLGLITP